jgi:hypothetical protein
MMRIPSTNTSIQLGGWVQLDSQVDFAGDSGVTFSPANIPLRSTDDGSRSTEHLRMTAQNTRVNFTSLTPTENGPVKAFFEMDFRGAEGSQTISNSHTPRLRHGYGSYNGFLFGQTWSNYFSLGTAADSIAWVNSSGGLFARQAQVRYTFDAKPAKVSLSLENPETRIGNAPAGSGDLDDLYPDLVAKASFKGPWGRADIAGLARLLRIDRGGVEEVALAGGGTANARINTTGDDAFFIQLNAGPGQGRYLDASFQDGYLVNGEIKLVDTYGTRLGYKHHWTKNVWSNVFGGVEIADNPTGFTGDPNRKLWSVHANIFWSPISQMWVGVEYIHGSRETESGAKGESDRIHFAARVKF